jgi:arginine N-succinyltransferase
MTWLVRPARATDIDALYELSHLTGGGFTNLPPDHDALAARVAWSLASFGRSEDTPDNELYLLVLEDAETGRIGGTCCLFSRVGAVWPFYSYRLSTVSQTSKELDRSFTNRVLHLVNDYDGASEVGGLFLRPDLRTGGLGRLLARSRYLFIAQHRARFGDRTLAELRGRLRGDGGSPFWDGLGARFFGMSFQEADRFNGVHGNQFIADLVPKHPIYVSLLSEDAQAAIGETHDSGRPAMRLLEAEGFSFEGYVDIFDGGPTLCSRTDAIKTVAGSRAANVAEIVTQPTGLPRALLAAGRLGDFRAWSGHADWCADGLVLPAAEVAGARLSHGDEVRYAAA